MTESIGTLVNESTRTLVGFAFDIDGVLKRGLSGALPEAREMFKLITDPHTGALQYPTVFFTNACGDDTEKARRLSQMFNIKIEAKNVIQAQTPLELYTNLHQKHCLFIGQKNLKQIAASAGFRKVSTIEDVTTAYPYLDMADHSKRSIKESVNGKLDPIEAVVLMGEPPRWESALQVVVDILMTGGRPDTPVTQDAVQPILPVIPCSMDLQFQGQYHIPRYGNGAFLLCLESLYRAVTGRELEYAALLGKPSELTYRFAEHRLQLLAQEKAGPNAHVHVMYMIGDNPNSDIVGANLYKRYISRLTSGQSPEVPSGRLLPEGATLSKQKINRVESVLVCTGIYKPSGDKDKPGLKHFHRDFQGSENLTAPRRIVPNVLDAVKYILDKECE